MPSGQIAVISFLLCGLVVAGPLDRAIVRDDTYCDASQAETANEAVALALANLQGPRCQAVIDAAWTKRLKRRLENNTVLVCQPNARGVSPHSTAYYLAPYIYLRDVFFSSTAVEQAATIFHEASHAVEAPAPWGHNDKFNALASYRMKGGLPFFRWVRDSVYLCSWYCNMNDQQLRAKVGGLLGLVYLHAKADEDHPEGKKRLDVLKAMRAENETFDYQAHAKKICNYGVSFAHGF